MGIATAIGDVLRAAFGKPKKSRYTAAVVLAGGSSTRMGEGVSKQQLLLRGAPLIVHTLLAFEGTEEIGEIVLVAKKDELPLYENYREQFGITKEQALEEFIADHQNDPAFGGVDAATLRHRYVVVLENNELMEDTAAQLSLIPGIAEVKADFEMAAGFITLQNVLHVASIAVIAVLLAVSLLIISNTVKLAMYARTYIQN